nr:hypothetical protein CFP56_21864 [Quercus suber]
MFARPWDCVTIFHRQKPINRCRDWCLTAMPHRIHAVPASVSPGLPTPCDLFPRGCSLLRSVHPIRYAKFPPTPFSIILFYGGFIKDKKTCFPRNLDQQLRIHRTTQPVLRIPPSWPAHQRRRPAMRPPQPSTRRLHISLALLAVLLVPSLVVLFLHLALATPLASPRTSGIISTGPSPRTTDQRTLTPRGGVGHCAVLGMACLERRGAPRDLERAEGRVEEGTVAAHEARYGTLAVEAMSSPPPRAKGSGGEDDAVHAPEGCAARRRRGAGLQGSEARGRRGGKGICFEPTLSLDCLHDGDDSRPELHILVRAEGKWGDVVQGGRYCVDVMTRFDQVGWTVAWRPLLNQLTPQPTSPTTLASREWRQTYISSFRASKAVRHATSFESPSPPTAIPTFHPDPKPVAAHRHGRLLHPTRVAVRGRDLGCAPLRKSHVRPTRPTPKPLPSAR